MNKKSHKILSLEKELQMVIANYIQEDSTFSDLGMNVIDVDLDQSFARAIVYYVTANNNEIENEALLKRRVKSVVANHFRDKFRRIPNIMFKYDDTYEKGRRLSKIIDGFSKNEED